MRSSVGYDLFDSGHAGFGIRRRPGRVVLHRRQPRLGSGPVDFGGRQLVSEIKRHQRLKSAAGRRRGQNPAAILARRRHRRNRRLQIGHDDGAAETARGMGNRSRKRGAVPQVQMPVVGAGNAELVAIHDYAE